MKAIIEKYYDILARAPLFGGLDAEAMLKLFEAVGASAARRAREESFIFQGDERPDIFVVLEGRAAGERVSADGGVFTVNEFYPGDEFGDLLSGSDERSPVTVTAKTDSAAVRISFERLFSASAAQRERAHVARNLVAITSKKYFALSRRMSLLLEPRLRRRVSAYLLSLAEAAGSAGFTAPHDREGMARYLGCERSALSRELSRMRAEGLIRFRKASFEIIDARALE